MARVLLVKASNVNFDGSVVPPLGLLYLAAVLRSRGEHDVRILDLRLFCDWRRALRGLLDEFDPHVVGFSAISMEYRNCREAIRVARERRPDQPVLVGGPHASALPERTLRETAADAVVVGEGEEVVAPLVEALSSGSRPSPLDGVVTRDDCGRTPTPAPRPDLDALPLPAWDLVDLAPYHRRQSMSAVGPYRYAVISTSRGCPFDCAYCHDLHGKRLRTRSVEAVAEELDAIQRLLGRGFVEVLDDSFNVKRDHARRVLELFARTDGRLRPVFGNGLRADRLDDDLLDLFRRCRCPEVSIAIESASPRIQEAFGKNLDLDAARRAVRGAARRGLYSVGFFMLGFPGETREEMQQTIRFALDEPITQALFNFVQPLPGTRLAPLASPVWQKDDPWTRESFYRSTINLSAVSDRELQRTYRRAYRSFYTRPGKVAGILARHPFKARLVRRALMVVRLAVPRRLPPGSDRDPGLQPV